MKKIPVLACACFIMAACNNNTTSKEASAATQQKQGMNVDAVQQQMQGDWRWKDDTSFHFVVANEKGWYTSSATPGADTQQLRYLNENCNPGARYDAAARHLIKTAPVYLNLWKIIDGRAHKKRCFAVLSLSSTSLQLMDTEKGVVFDYIR